MKKLKLFTYIAMTSLVALTASSCAMHQQGSYHPKLYSKGSKAKGVVSVLPVFFRSGKVTEILPWNLQTEFTEEISKRFAASDKLLLIKNNVPLSSVEQFYSPIASNISTNVSAQFLPAEFVIATELLEQTTKTIANQDYISASIRVRVFDIRRNQVSMIYQEIVEATQPVAATASDYHRYGWKTKHFDATPMGIMHHRLFREMVTRVEGYVCANYS